MNHKNIIDRFKFLYLLAVVASIWASSFELAYPHGVKYHEFVPIDRRMGMDASVVYCLVQDNQGMIWMGTNQGLYSFDGYSARYHSSVNEAAQSNSGVVYCALLVDSAHIWLGSENGLMVFNTVTDRFEQTPQGLPLNIRAIARITNHSYWLGSMNGLYLYNSETGKVDKINDPAIPHQAIYAILRYDENTYYFGTYNGLCRYDAIAKRFEKVALGNPGEHHNQLILSLLADYDRNCIWVGVEGGLFTYNHSTKQSSEVPLFNRNSIKSLLIDNQKCLWAGTDDGLFIYDPQTSKYRIIRHDALNDRSLVNNIVWSVFADKEQNIWLGTDAGVSLCFYNDKYKVRSVSEITGSSEGNQIISLLTDSKGNLWLGGTNGLIKVDKNKGSATWFQQNSKTHPLPHNKVRFIFEDFDGDVWIATDGSICRYDDKSAQFVRYQIEDATHVRNANWAYAICQDETHKLWVATCLGGVFVVDKQKLLASAGNTYVAEQNFYVNSGANSLSGSMLQYISVDGDHNIWAGTYRAGFNKIDRQNQRVIQFTANSPENPLPSDDVTAMAVGKDGFLWIALRNKLLKLVSHDHKMELFADSRMNDSYINAMSDDGLHLWLSTTTGLFMFEKGTSKFMKINSGANFYASVCYNEKNQTVVAGGNNEFVEFDANTIALPQKQNNLCLTSLFVNDHLVQPNDTSNLPVQLAQSIRFTKSIELPYQFNNLAFEFSELVYNHGASGQYAYKLSGLDVDWHYTSGNDNRLVYNNLRPGAYTLVVSRLNGEGHPLPNPLSLSVIIHHPWYSSVWAKIIYSILFVALILAIANYFLVLNRLRFERLEKLKTLELSSHKIEFLTNISHELKTPLSLIVGPLGKIIAQVKSVELKEQLEYVKLNASKLQTLINQLMNAAREQTDGFGLIVSTFDLVEFIKSEVSVFEKISNDKGVTISVETDQPKYPIEGDLLKIEGIVNNLMSNAVKFSPSNTQISVQLSVMGDGVALSISDQGPGIPAKDLPYVFDRFFQSKESLRLNKDGSGIGLSIVKNYVDLHHGRVQAYSEPGMGTKIMVYLPTKQEGGISKPATTNLAENTALTTAEKGKPVLLIVEDNNEILMFVAKQLSSEFNCLVAHNGKIGFDLALEKRPDLIITDIMMPVMDGIEMCKRLKENIATASIPVLMLTAKDDKNTELLGYQTGADAFLSKPFEITYLTERVRQLLTSRKHLVQKARQEAMIQPVEINALSADDRFLESITKVIEANITDADLNVNQLCERTGYNAKQVYRRIKALTGQTAVDYIRSVRLKKAATLLGRKTFTVAEVMYMVGFNNHSYFAKRFQELYGKSPKQYMDEFENR
jgi:signal transduction histidine kinase/ligand-binding sensor domain-containing protein/DNA-binding response OmpR family regulator